MIAYACVYRRPVPRESERKRTAERATSNQMLRHFLDRYDRSFLDWGDDPSFFAAEQKLGDARHASWGVCRADVRGKLSVGDFVVFFAGIPRDRLWEYYWVGLGTVKRLVRNRHQIWTEKSLSVYRQFFNLLVEPARESLNHREHFYPEHTDWERRMASLYVLFDPDLSSFNISNPVHVSTYRQDEGVPDQWRRNTTVRRLEFLLFGNQIRRRLRTSKSGYGHVKLRLNGTDDQLSNLRSELLTLLDSRMSRRLPISAPHSRLRSARSGAGCS